MLKRTLILILVLSLALLPGLSASAETKVSESEFRKYNQAMFRAIEGKFTGDNGLTYLCEVDINGDGYREVVLDNSHGWAGQSLLNLNPSAGFGMNFLLIQGDCTVLWYDPAKGTVSSVSMKNDNMYFSCNEEEQCFIASTREDGYVRFTVLRLTEDCRTEEIIYKLTPEGEVLSVTVNGKEDERLLWTCMPEEIYNCRALTFTMYS